MAAALPRFLGDRQTVAPASRAARTVSSVEPSLATTTASTPGSVSAAVTVSPIRSASLYAGMTTATGGMRPILVNSPFPVSPVGSDSPARAAKTSVGREVGDGEDRVEAGHREDPPHRWARRGEFELTAALARLAQAGKQHVHAGGVAELHA